MWALVATASFERRFKRFRRLHPDMRPRIARVLSDLEADPFAPHLRLHPLQGEMAGLHAVRLTQGYRLIVSVRAIERELVLLDIGGHDEVYR